MARTGFPLALLLAMWLLPPVAGTAARVDAAREGLAAVSPIHADQLARGPTGVDLLREIGGRVRPAGGEGGGLGHELGPSATPARAAHGRADPTRRRAEQTAAALPSRDILPYFPTGPPVESWFPGSS